MEENKKNYTNILSQFENLNESEKIALEKFLYEDELTEKDKTLLKKIYILNMKKQKKDIEAKIKTSKIRGLISCVSFSYNESIEKYKENIYDKNLDIFSNIDTFFLLYTKESENNFKKIKEHYKNINIVGVLVTNYTFLSIQTSINDSLKKLKLNKDNCIIDITLGMKIITICLYKLAVENEIKAINWQEIQVPKSKSSGLQNVPFNAKLNLMIEPRKANIKMYAEINELLEKYNFEGIKSFYSKLNNEDMEFFYSELQKLFSFEVMINLDYTVFFKRVKEFFFNLSERKEYQRETIMKVRGFLIGLLSLIISENEDENIIETDWLQDFFRIFQISLDDIEEEKFFLEEYKNLIYYYYVLEYFKAKVKDSSEENYYYTKFIKDIKLNILKELYIKDKEIEKKFMKENGSVNDLIDIDISDILEEITPAVSLKENLNGEFSMRNNTLFIEKYNLKLDTDSDLRLKFLNNKGSDLIRLILENTKSGVKGEELFKKLAKYKIGEEEEKRKGRFRKNLSMFKKKIDKFNGLMEVIGKEQGLEMKNLIVYKKSKKQNEESDYSHAFYVNPKFYMLV